MARSGSATSILVRLVVPVYVPITAGTIGLGMMIPVLPLYLAAQGISLETTSVVLSAIGLGAAIGGLPAGALVQRVGSRAVLVGSLALIAACTALLGVTTSALALAGFRVATGMGNITLRLSRQTFITQRVPVNVRGRAMSLIGGSFRFALLVGPLLGGLLVDTMGFRATFATAGALTLLGAVPSMLSGDERVEPDAAPTLRRPGVLASLRSHWRSLLVAGVVPLLVMTVREGRFVVLPLIGDDLGLSATEVGALVAVGTASDLLLFPVAGWVMDRFGRLPAMIPAFGLIGLGLTIVGLANSTTTVVIGGAVVGVGNGLSSGSMLTLGSDLAPADSPSPFLAGMAVMQDGGRVVGPLMVGLVGGWFDLGMASLALAALCLLVIAWLVLVLGETSRRASVGTPR